MASDLETITYSRLGSLDIQFDLYSPLNPQQGPRPSIVFFHGGGMAAGCRKTLIFQKWLKG